MNLSGKQIVTFTWAKFNFIQVQHYWWAIKEEEQASISAFSGTANCQMTDGEWSTVKTRYNEWSREPENSYVLTITSLYSLHIIINYDLGWHRLGPLWFWMNVSWTLMTLDEVGPDENGMDEQGWTRCLWMRCHTLIFSRVGTEKRVRYIDWIRYSHVRYNEFPLYLKIKNFWPSWLPSAVNQKDSIQLSWEK